MFGKFKTNVLFNSLKAFGFDINTMLPQLEGLIIKEAEKIEAELGKRLLLTATNTENGILVVLYTQDPNIEDAPLEYYKQFPFTQIIENLKSVIANDTANAEITETANEANGND